MIDTDSIIYDENKVYLAGPFFNAEQITWMEWLESICEKYNIPYFAPRLHGAKLDLENPTLTNRREVFESDVKGYLSCGLVLASLDWLLPKDTIIQECTLNDAYFNEYRVSGKPNLNLPDSGTVFECGMTYGFNLAMNIIGQGNSAYLVGYLTKRTPLVNLMLTDSLSGILPDKHAIEVFLESWISHPDSRDRLIADVALIHQWNGGCQ